jgi:NSS family neurotransmitter:Na+ symporter
MRETWSGRAGFVLAAIGGAVGLGSIWKFPYEVGANGGAAFVLFYVGGLVLAVVPLMLAEFAIGRRGAADAAGSLAAVARAHGASARWAWVGVTGIVAGLLILSFYSVIGGWTIAYAVETALEGLAGTEADAVRARFDALLGSPLRLAAYHALFMAASALIVARGVGGGIEAACRLLMPALAVLMLGLATYSMAYGDLGAALRFLVSLDPARISARAALDALGLGFFSIGVGFGLMITYAAYAGPDIDLPQAAVAIVVADTAISLLAGLAVFPVLFAHGLDPAAGPGLVFVTLPLAFAAMPFGAAAALAFYVLLFVAALASAISMMELAAALLTRSLGWSRRRAAAASALACFTAGLGTVLSFNVWSGWRPSPFEFVDQLTSNYLLPACGFALALFAGWALPARFFAEELRLGAAAAARLHGFLRYAVPVGIAAAAAMPFLSR